MKKLKNIIIALCMCVCIGFSCLGLSGCADTRTKEELASLKTQVEQLETENNQLKTESATLERDKALTKIYEAFAYTADDSNVNATISATYLYFNNYILQIVPFAIHYYRYFDLNLDCVYTMTTGKVNVNFFISVAESKIIYRILEEENYYQLTITLDENDSITNIEYISKISGQIGAGTYTEYCEANYVVNSSTPFDENNIDTFEIRTIIYDVNNGSGVEEFLQVGGTYDKYGYYPDGCAAYNITEVKKYNVEVNVSGELTVNETLSQEQANAELESMKTLYDVSSYLVEELDVSLIIG